MAKEFNIVVDEPFIKGLRPNDRMPRNTPYLTTCVGAEVRAEGLRAYEDITAAVSSAELTAKGATGTYPFPQIFKLKGKTILCDQAKIFTVSETDWTITQVTTYDYYTPANTKAIVSGESWQCADFHDTVMLFNGSCVIMKYGDDAKWYVQDQVSIECGTEFRGRFIVGGFDPTDFWYSTWETNWTSRITSEDPPNSNIPQTMQDMKDNWIYWSTIGGGDIRFLYDPSAVAISGSLGTSAHGATEALFMDYAKRNQWGWAPMPWQGKVLAIKPLGRSVVAYGEDGITVLTPQNTELGTGFGETLTLPIGINSRNAVAGDDASHVFMSDDGSLWILTADLQHKRLDYSEHLDTLLGSDVLCTFDPHSRHYRVTDGTNSFMLSESGLSEIDQAVKSSFFTQGGLVGLFDTLSPSPGFQIVSQPIDFGVRAVKQIVGVEVGGAPEGSLKVAFDYRYDSDTAFKRTPLYPLSREGFSQLRIAGTEFRLVVQATAKTNVELDYVQIKWQADDKRAIRSKIRT